jgi:hypothetical protein
MLDLPSRGAVRIAGGGVVEMSTLSQFGVHRAA